MCACLSVCVPYAGNACRSENRVFLQAVVSCHMDADNKPGLSVRAISSPDD